MFWYVCAFICILYDDAHIKMISYFFSPNVYVWWLTIDDWMIVGMILVCGCDDDITHTHIHTHSIQYAFRIIITSTTTTTTAGIHKTLEWKFFIFFYYGPIMEIFFHRLIPKLTNKSKARSFFPRKWNLKKKSPTRTIPFWMKKKTTTMIHQQLSLTK